MDILVTGGAGFIGSNLCERLVQTKSNRVVSVDNYTTGSRDNHVDGVTYVYTDTKTINTYGLGHFDLVFHLGEYSRVEQSFDDFEKVWEQNILGTKEVVKFCADRKAKLIYAGSSTKFGDIGSNSSPYAWTKATNTEFVENYAKWYGLRYAITYFYNVYGKREISHGKYATLIAKFNEKRKRGEALTVTSPGTQLRNFTHVDDIVDGLILVAANGYGDEYGIGSSEAYSVLDIANMFGCKIEMTEPKEGNRMTSPLITQNTEMLGWKAQRNVKDYIEKLKNEN